MGKRKRTYKYKNTRMRPGSCGCTKKHVKYCYTKGVGVRFKPGHC